MAKIQNPLLLTLYSKYVDRILSNTASIEDANQHLRDFGREIGAEVYLTTEIVDKTKDTVSTREDVAKLMDVIFKSLFNKKPSNVDMKTARGSVRVTDKECLWCQDVHLEGKSVV